MEGSYNSGLIFASFCVAVASMYGAFDLGSRIGRFDARRQMIWMLLGGLAVGTGIASMQFIGMRAFVQPASISYSSGIALLSWLSAVGVSTLALYVISGNRLSYAGIFANSAMMGVGFCFTQYIGVAAMRIQPAIQYDPGLFAASAVLAVLSSAAMLFIGFSLRSLPESRIVSAKIGAALIVGGALCSIHHTGMAAGRFAGGALNTADHALGSGWIGLPLALLACILIAAVIVLSLVDAGRVIENERMAAERGEADRLYRLASYDIVTGLPNRTLFTEKLITELVSAHTERTPFGLVYAELRNYRLQVEAFGQTRMNEILQAVVQQISREMHAGDVLARLTQDGLILRVHEDDTRSTHAALSALCALLSTPVQNGGEQFRFTWGIGYSHFPEHGNSSQTLIRAAMKIQGQIGAEPAVRAVSNEPRYALAS